MLDNNQVMVQERGNEIINLDSQGQRDEKIGIVPRSKSYSFLWSQTLISYSDQV
jgi:hypothetical protein